MKRTIALLIVTGFLVVGCNGGAFESVVPVAATRGQVGAVMVRKGPAIDGTLNSKLWQKCPPLVLGECQSDQIGELKTTARVLFDKTHLYVAWECLEPDSSRIKAQVADRDGQVWQDDYVDLFITGDARVGYFHFLVNPRGTLLDAKIPEYGEADVSWNSTAVVKTSTDKDKRWIVTLSVPLKEIGAYVGENQTWPMNLNRTRPLGGNQYVESSWSSKGLSAYKDPSGWGKVVGVRVRRSSGGVTRTAEPAK